MLAIRLPAELELRLENLAKKTGRTKTFYAREAIVEYIDDLEDYYLAEARAKSAGKNISMSEMKVRLGLDD